MYIVFPSFEKKINKSVFRIVIQLYQVLESLHFGFSLIINSDNNTITIKL